MMKQISNLENSKNVESCSQILSSLALALCHIHLKKLVSVAGVDENPEDLDKLKVLIELSVCFLTAQEGTVHFIHQSAKDYFATGKGSQIFSSGQKAEHCKIMIRSLEAMSNTLRKDMCNLTMPGVFLDQLGVSNRDFLPYIRYAYAYWVYRPSQTGYLPQHKTGPCDDGEVHKFLKNNFLHWLEALSILDMMPNGSL